MGWGDNSFSKKLDDFLIRYLGRFNYRSYVKRMNLCGDEKVLEVGCGGGNLSRFLTEKVKGIVCIDRSEYWIKKARWRLKKFGNIEFELTDVLDFGKEDYFDAIVVHYVLHDVVERDKAIGVFRKCLRKNGVVYVREPIRKSHGIFDSEIRDLFLRNGFGEQKFWEGYSFPLRGKVCEFVFEK